MKRRALSKRLDNVCGIGGSGLIPGAYWVRIEIAKCRTQAEYDRAFDQAWEQVPMGAAVFHFPTLNEEEWQLAIQGLPPLIRYRSGIFLKTLLEGVE